MALFQPSGQVKLTNVAIVKMKFQQEGKNFVFEVPAYKNKILSYRDGQETNVDEVVQIARVFKSVNKGEYAKKLDMQACFGMIRESEVMKIVLKQGEMQISDKERDAHFGSLATEVAQLVYEKVYDIRTGSKLPLAVVERTLKDVGFSVQPNVSSKRQALTAVATLVLKRPNIIGRYNMELRLRVPGESEEVFRQLIARATEDDVKFTGTHTSTQGDKQDWVELGFVIKTNRYKDIEALGGKLTIVSQTVIDEDAMEKAIKAIELEALTEKKKVKQDEMRKERDHMMKGYHAKDDEQKAELAAGAMLDFEDTAPKVALAPAEIKPAGMVSAAPKHRPAFIPPALKAQQEAARLEQEQMGMMGGMGLGAPVVAEAPVPVAPAAPVVSSAVESSAPAELKVESTPVPEKSRGMMCSTCKTVINGGAMDFRNHSKTDWHAHNVKRKVRTMDPLSEEQFDSTPEKELNKFLAQE